MEWWAGVPRTSSRFSDSLRLSGLGHDSTQGKDTEPRCMGQSVARSVQLPESSPCGVTQDMLIPLELSCDNILCIPGELIRHSAPRVFIEGWSRQQPLPGTFQHSRLPEGKQVFSRNHVVLYRQFRRREPLPQSRFPDTSQGSPGEQRASGLLCLPCSDRRHASPLGIYKIKQELSECRTKHGEQIAPTWAPIQLCRREAVGPWACDVTALCLSFPSVKGAGS